MDKVVILIPTLNPKEKFLNYVDELVKKYKVIVVDDGSTSKEILKRLNNKCILLKHEINKGKGCALKTGFKYVLDNLKGFNVLTTDDDGQHALSDIDNIIQLSNDEDFFIGVRNFDLKNVPLKRKISNKITAFLFNKLYNQNLTDTQTGLRVYPYNLLYNMIKISGNNFEYEMNVLIWCAKNNIKINEVPIETIYNNEKNTSHFKIIKDSYKIYKEMLNGNKKN